jgi:hypothetical protein
VRVAIEAARRHEKPVAIVTNFGWTIHPGLTRRLTEAKIPLIEGTKCGLIAMKNLLADRICAPCRRSSRRAGRGAA